MVDIWKNLTDINLAEFGWQLRVPVAEALRNLNYNGEADILDDIAIIRNNVNSGSLIPLARSGDKVVESILDATMKLRTLLRNSSVDSYILSIVNNYLNFSQGNNYKTNIFKILKSYMNGINNEVYEQGGYTLIDKKGEAIFLAGNEDIMIKPQPDTDYAGLRIVFDENISYTEFIVTVENIFGEAKLTLNYTPTAGQQDMVIWVYDEITNIIPPGILRVSIVDAATGEIRNDVHIYSYACKFGMNEPEGYFTTTERDYVYITDATSAHILLYIGPFKRIKTPVTLDNKPVESISSSAFYEQDMQAVKIIGSPDIID